MLRRNRGLPPSGVAKGERSMTHRALLHVLTLCGVLALASAADAGDERVRLVLYNGDAIEGRVYDLGNQYLELHRSLGSTRLAKSEVESWTLVIDREAEGAPPGILIVLRGGHEIGGDVRFLPETLEWVVRLGAGEARYPEKEVIRTIPPSGVCSDGKFTPRVGFLDRIREAVESVRSESVLAQEEGKTFVEAAGFFGLRELERSLAESGMNETLARLELRERFRVVLPAGIEVSFPKLLDQLSDGQSDTRVPVLQEALVEQGSDLYPLLGLLLLDPRQPVEVRSFSIDVLGRMHRIRELLEAFRTSKGRAQLALAIALGDNGVYIGIPTLIEALSIDASTGEHGSKGSKSARELALQRLHEYSGENFGFDPETSPEQQAAAIDRWRTWWNENRPAVEDSLRQNLVEGTESPRRRRAADLWRRGMMARARGQNESAEQFFAQAREADPTSMAPLVSLGIIAYDYRQDLQGGIDFFRQALSRPSAEGEEPLRRLCYFHLGRIYQEARDYEMARKSLVKAVEIDPSFSGGWYELGRVQYQQALLISGEDPGRRREALVDARSTFEDGIRAIEGARERQTILDTNALPYDDDLPFSTREHNRSLREIREQLRVEIGRFHHQCAVISLALGEPQVAKGHIAKAREFSIEPSEPLERLEATVDRLIERAGRQAETPGG